MLIGSELATNAIKHTASGLPRCTFIVEVARTAEVVTVAVYDCGGGGVPRSGRAGRPYAERGRSLAVVGAVADRIGHEGDGEVGHKVWASIDISPVV